MTEEQHSVPPQNPYIYGNVRDIALCPEADVSIQTTPLSSPWNGIQDEKSPSRSRRRRRDTSTQIRPLSALNQAILKVHSSLSHKLERLGPTVLNEASSEVFMMKSLNWLRLQFVRDPIALSYIDGDLTTRSLSLQWSLESNSDDQLLDDLLKVGFPDLTSGVSAKSPALVVSPIYYENYQRTDALHILPLGKVFGSSQPMTIETYWGKVSCKRVDQTEYPKTRNLVGLPPAIDNIKVPLLWAYNQIQSEPKDRVERCFSAQSRYQEVEKNKRSYFEFDKGDFDRNSQHPVIAKACTWLRSRIAYFAYDLALFTGNSPKLDPVGGGWPEIVKLRTMYKSLRGDLDSYLNSSESQNLVEPMRIAEAKEFAELNLSDLVNTNITNSLNDVVREFVRDFSKDYPGVITENSVFEIDTVDVPIPSEAWLAGEYAYLANPRLYLPDSKKRMSLSDMLMQKIPAGPWRHVRNGQAASAVPDEHRRAIKERITRGRYDMDTEIPFRFQQLLDSKHDYFSRVFDTSLSLHAHVFMNGSHQSHQKALVKDFLAGKKPAYKCAFDDNTVFGTVFIPYQVDDTSSPWRANLNKNGLLYSPFNGFVWLEGYQFSKAQYAAIRNGLLPEGKSALDATKNVRGLTNKGVIHPGLSGMGGVIYSDLPRIPTGPILDFDVRVGGEEIKSGNLSRYLVNSISEYYDKVFDLQHLSLQEQWDEIRDHLMLAVSILNIVAIPFPYLGLALIAGNMTIAIVTLTDPRSSSGDKAWAIADLLLEPLGAVGDVVTLSRSALKPLGSLPSASRGIETSEYMKRLAKLAQDALQAKRGLNHKLEGVIRRIGRRGSHANFTSGASLPNSKSSGLCRGLALKDAISRLNDAPIDNLPKELRKNKLIADDVQNLHRTQPIVTDRSLVLSSDEARLATRRAVEDPSRGGNFVALDEEMTFSQAKKELLVQLAKHNDVSFVIGTHSHAVSLSKRGSGANAGLTFFDPAKQTRHWALGDEEKNISEILSHIASRYDSGVAKQVDDHPLLLTVLAKQPESRHVYVPKDGMESLKAAVYQLDLDLSQGRLIQPITVKNSAAKTRMQANLDSLKTSESSLAPLLNKVTIEEIQPSQLASLPAENSAITVIGHPSVAASDIANDLRALPAGYRDVRYLDVRFATNKLSAETYQIRQARRENIVPFETTGASSDPCETLTAEMRSAGQSHIQVRDGDLPFPQDRTSDEWRRIGIEQQGKKRSASGDTRKNDAKKVKKSNAKSNNKFAPIKKDAIEFFTGKNIPDDLIEIQELPVSKRGRKIAENIVRKTGGEIAKTKITITKSQAAVGLNSRYCTMTNTGDLKYDPIRVNRILGASDAHPVESLSDLSILEGAYRKRHIGAYKPAIFDTGIIHSTAMPTYTNKTPIIVLSVGLPKQFMTNSQLFESLYWVKEASKRPVTLFVHNSELSLYKINLGTHLSEKNIKLVSWKFPSNNVVGFGATRKAAIEYLKTTSYSKAFMMDHNVKSSGLDLLSAAEKSTESYPNDAPLYIGLGTYTKTNTAFFDKSAGRPIEQLTMVNRNTEFDPAFISSSEDMDLTKETQFFASLGRDRLIGSEEFKMKLKGEGIAAIKKDPVDPTTREYRRLFKRKIASLRNEDNIYVTIEIDEETFNVKVGDIVEFITTREFGRGKRRDQIRSIIIEKLILEYKHGNHRKGKPHEVEGILPEHKLALKMLDDEILADARRFYDRKKALLSPEQAEDFETAAERSLLNPHDMDYIEDMVHYDSYISEVNELFRMAQLGVL